MVAVGEQAREAHTAYAEADAQAAGSEPESDEGVSDHGAAAEMAHEAAEAMPAPEIQQPTPIAASRDESPAAVPVGAAVTRVGFESATDDIDDELRKVLLEEFQEENQNQIGRA